MNTDSIKIIFVGDILIHSFYNKIASNGDPSFVFQKISHALSDAEIRFGNLETVLSKKGSPIDGKGCLLGNEKYIRSLKDVDFNMLSLANNHTFDFGLEAFEDMSINLQKAGIRTVGAGFNLEESRKISILTVNDISLGFLAYSSRTNNGQRYATKTSQGVAPLEEEIVIEDIKKNKKDVDFLIVSLHWGIEHSPYPTPEQVLFAHKVIDAGVKIIIGNHPQILQGIEYYKDGLIMYSLGNFCHSDYYWEGPQKTYRFRLKDIDRESIIVKAKLFKDGKINIDVVPMRVNSNYQPEVCEGERKDAILQKLKARSEMIKKPDFDKYWNDLVIKKRVGNPFKIWWQNGSLLYKLKNFKFSQIKSLLDLFLMYVHVKFSKSPSKWQMFNPRNDKKPRPFCGEDEESKK